MSGVDIVRVVLLGLVAVVWAIWAFGIWSKLRARTAESGGSLTQQLGQWWRATEDRSGRNMFLFLSFVLFAMIASRLLISTG